ncbi:carboxypeptidase M32 [Oceanivirga salmonicida]|uniref:carboxypeptidase M32 n=1 Tax=Oceanivirga salmonicida TaxID=1769291 RepID=UPI00082C7856|nr:carboxypeptidase M32 [Oceanivirga salmonicida]
MEDKLKKLYDTIKKDSAYNHAMTLLSWDLETAAAKKSVEGISNTMETLSELQYKNLVNDEFKELLYSIDEEKISELDRKVVKKLKKNVFEKMSKIPVDEYSKYKALVSKSQSAWEEAKNKNDYNIFKPYLKELIEYNKKFIKYRGYEHHPYNVLIDDFEEGMTVEKADKFFNLLKKDLVPFALKILNTKNEKIEKIRHKLQGKFDIEKQRKLSLELAKILGFDFSKGVMSESEHPFTIGMNNKDVRFTSHYLEEDILSGIFSTAHEVGHAIYEQQIDDKYDNSKVLSGGATMGIHEAQSRFSENVIAKHRAYMPLMNRLIKKYLDLDLTDDELYLLANEVKNQYIRVDADELTYSIHVLIRYELEKEIFENLDKEVNVDELNEKWDNMYEKYLGIRPRNYAEGILQDSHWSGGLFGYFASYAIGTAYASQMFESLCKNVDIENVLRNEKFDEINKFLKETIHQYGASKSADELIRSCCNEDFEPRCYINYLKEKFIDIYEIGEVNE